MFEVLFQHLWTLDSRLWTIIPTLRLKFHLMAGFRTITFYFRHFFKLIKMAFNTPLVFFELKLY